MAKYTPPEWIADRIAAGSESAVTLSETLARIDGRVRATIEFEKTAALSWCHANGNPHLLPTELPPMPNPTPYEALKRAGNSPAKAANGRKCHG